MYAAQQEGPAIQKEATMNDRLNRVLDGIKFNSDRIEVVLARVNGTPQKETGNRDKVMPISPTHPLAGVVEMLEQAHQRLAELATGVERIA